ncbi:MAG: hypothetical protein HY377_00650 [Candidatus Blackburnbacteria bacterium]|nr:hypothetical protein [Candidatus Blackburnbacteria bacterium]
MVSVEPRLVNAMPTLAERHYRHVHYTWRYGDPRYVVRLDYLDHCGNCPGAVVSWVEPEELANLTALYFKPIVVIPPTDAERIARGRETNPTWWTVLLDGGIEPRKELAERRGALPNAVGEPGKTLWVVVVRQQGDEFYCFALPFAPEQWQHRFWRVAWGRISPNFDRHVPGEPEKGVFSEDQLDASTSWIRDVWIEGQKKLAGG